QRGVTCELDSRRNRLEAASPPSRGRGRDPLGPHLANAAILLLDFVILYLLARAGAPDPVAGAFWFPFRLGLSPVRSDISRRSPRPRMYAADSTRHALTKRDTGMAV